MSRAARLIAGREFRAYVATASFWVALVLAPLLMGAAALAISATPKATPISILAEPAIASDLQSAVLEAARIEGRRVRVAAMGGKTVRLRALAADRFELAFEPGFPLTPSGQALVRSSLELKRMALNAGAAEASPAFRLAAARGPARPATSAGSRMGLVFLLWIVLTGSLGMLLQAVVRERSNKALELLLTSARPWEIVAGKVAGVGLVSLLVAGAWLGSAVVAAIASGSPQVAASLALLLQPLELARAAAFYLLTFALYGFTTVAVGAQARDSASAQNLARPMFSVLLVAFFVAMAASQTPGGLSWLAFAPPFAPFILLLQPPSALDVVGLGLMALATAAAAWAAVARLQMSPGPGRPFRR